MVGTSPESDRDRWQLGFAAAVMETFGFLAAAGFLVESEEEWEAVFVRYESPATFVTVYYDRLRGDLDVAIGRWIDVDGQRVAQSFSLRDFMALEHEPTAVGYPSVVSGHSVAKFVPMLAQWTEEFCQEALRGDSTAFNRVSARNATDGTKLWEGWEASRLRQAADDAWRRKDWGRVVNAYAEMEAELRTVELKASEVGQLKFARKQLDAAD